MHSIFPLGIHENCQESRYERFSPHIQKQVCEVVQVLICLISSLYNVDMSKYIGQPCSTSTWEDEIGKFNHEATLQHCMNSTSSARLQLQQATWTLVPSPCLFYPKWRCISAEYKVCLPYSSWVCSDLEVSWESSFCLLLSSLWKRNTVIISSNFESHILKTWEMHVRKCLCT